jgi:dihydropteroate synthase
MEHVLGGDPLIMGVVNVTPDSFSDGGQFADENQAIAHAVKLCEDGADIIDIGGESTRPGAGPVSIREEIDRVCPVIEGVKDHVKWVSIDSRNPETLKAALKSGANFINDVSALSSDGSIALAAKSGVPVCLMHMLGKPNTMQSNPSYNNVVEDVFDFLQERINACEEGGISKSHIIVDPGIGFGKTLEHNLLLIGNISRFLDLEVPVMLGASRKSFIGKISPEAAVDKRLPGSIVSVLWALEHGVQIFRVHDVYETRQAMDVFFAISGAGD